MRQVADRGGEHAEVLRRNAGKTFKAQRIGGGNITLGIQQRPVNIEELAAGHLTIVGNGGQGVDVLMNDVDEFLELVVVLRFADKALGQLAHREFLTQVSGEEQHQTQATIHLAARLESGAVLLVLGLDRLGITRLTNIATNRRGNHRGAYRAGGFVSQSESAGGVQAAMIGVHSLLRADNRGTRMLQHKHGQIVGIGVGHVQVFAVHINGGGKATRIDNLDQRVRNGLRAQARRNRIQTETGNRGLRHTRRGARRMLGELGLIRLGGNRHRTSQIVGGGKHRHIFRLEHQTDARFVAQLQTVGREVLAFRLGRILRLP